MTKPKAKWGPPQGREDADSVLGRRISSPSPQLTIRTIHLPSFLLKECSHQEEPGIPITC
ncbi:hypothetical protein EWB00_000116 [Schistosoma japonicum]|uniref:Uncharacterized protein n=1 Tax=Schistosoma japonicum TaxID=6182 RepID=A0A4Z2CKM0_SCHJA|nr:hypothetical protein EWB00_000116 [Schistosoma japonicum]